MHLIARMTLTYMHCLFLCCMICAHALVRSQEYDATMIEMCGIKQELQRTRQELSHALYQCDAAKRVITRLVAEKEAMQEKLIAEARTKRSNAAPGADTQEPAPKKTKAAAGDAGEGAQTKAKFTYPSAILDAMSAHSKTLVQARKKRTISETLVMPEQLGAMKEVRSFALHKTTKRGIFCMDASDEYVVSGGADGNVVVLNTDSGKVAQKLQGHTHAVNAVRFIPEKKLILSGGSDKCVRMWKADDTGSYTCEEVFADSLDGDVLGVHVQPTQDYFLTTTSKASWSFYDIESASCVGSVTEAGGAAFTTSSIHPDGMLLITGGSDSVVRIWDIRAQENVMSFQGHRGAISGSTVSENGFFIATTADDGAQVWDLRKFKSVKQFAFNAATCVAFDYSGTYLAVAGADSLAVFQPKPKQDSESLLDVSKLPKGGVSTISWMRDAKGLWVGGRKDHTLKLLK